MPEPTAPGTLGLDDDLEPVEALEAIERAFAVIITDAEAARCRTVGDLFALLRARFASVPGAADRCVTAMAFHRLRRALPDPVATPETPLAALSALPARHLLARPVVARRPAPARRRCRADPARPGHASIRAPDARRACTRRRGRQFRRAGRRRRAAGRGLALARAGGRARPAVGPARFGDHAGNHAARLRPGRRRVIYVLLNAGPILAATVAGLLIGAAWYRPASPGLAVTAFIAEAWLAAILAGALILAPTTAGAWTMAIGSAVVIWVGFVLPALAVSLRARAVPWRTIASDGAHWLVVMVAQAVVLKAIGLVPPPAA